jgi:hypothetical protein
LLACLPAWGADQAWTKVRALKSGTELRIYRRGEHRPLPAKLDEATDENLIIVLKNEQEAIPKDEIDRLDYRPRGSRVTTDSRRPRSWRKRWMSRRISARFQAGFQNHLPQDRC